MISFSYIRRAILAWPRVQVYLRFVLSTECCTFSVFERRICIAKVSRTWLSFSLFLLSSPQVSSLRCAHFSVSTRCFEPIPVSIVLAWAWIHIPGLLVFATECYGVSTFAERVCVLNIIARSWLLCSSLLSRFKWVSPRLCPYLCSLLDGFSSSV